MGLLRKVNIALARSKPEKKFLDEGVITTSITSAGVVVEPFSGGIFQGIGSNDRIGNRLYVRNYDIRWSIRYNALSDFPMQIVRVLWVMWSNDGSPSVLDILTTASIFSHYTKTNVATWKLLSDRFYYVGRQGKDRVETMHRSIIPIKKTWVYSGNLDLTPVDHRVFYILLTNEETLLDQPNFDFNGRLNYYDA